MKETRLYALRGAVCCLNTEEDIELRVAELYDELLSINSLSESEIVSLIFSITGDIDALNPAAALRRSGRAQELALFSTAEPFIKGSLSGLIRVIIHCYLPKAMPLHHVYRNGAEILRPDRVG